MSLHVHQYDVRHISLHVLSIRLSLKYQYGPVYVEVGDPK